MNPLSKTLLLSLLCLFSIATYAQQKPDLRPKLFSNLPETIKVNNTALKDAFNFFEGQQVSISLANDLVFSGVVVSNEVKYSNLQTVIIKSASLNNALLSVSKMINADKTISYTGRILGNNSFDGYEIKSGIDGQYSMQKFETAKILQVCSY